MSSEKISDSSSVSPQTNSDMNKTSSKLNEPVLTGASEDLRHVREIDMPESRLPLSRDSMASSTSRLHPMSRDDSEVVHHSRLVYSREDYDENPPHVVSKMSGRYGDRTNLPVPIGVDDKGREYFELDGPRTRPYLVRSAAPATVSRMPETERAELQEMQRGSASSHTTSETEGFSQNQMSLLLHMQKEQSESFQKMLSDALRFSRSRSRSPRSRSRRKRRYYTSSSCSSSSSRSRSRSRSPKLTSEERDKGSTQPGGAKSPKQIRLDQDTPSPKSNEQRDKDEISLFAGDDLTSDQPASSDVGKKPEEEKDELINPHQEAKGTMYTQKNLDWWEIQRTHVLEQQKKDDMLDKLKPDPSVTKFFKAPDMPKPMRASMKKSKVDAWKSDNSMWSIQEDMLRASMPLLKALELNQAEINNKEMKRLLECTGSLLGSAVQRLSIWRLRHAEPFLKEGYLKDVSPSVDCIFGKEWTQKVEEEEKLNKVTQKVVKEVKDYSSNKGPKQTNRASRPYQDRHNKQSYRRRHGHRHSRHSHQDHSRPSTSSHMTSSTSSSDNFRQDKNNNKQFKRPFQKN